MYVIGCTRFSVFAPDSNAWHLSKLSREDYLSELYADERMNDRFDIFFGKAAPIYELFSKKCFYRHIIQYSDVMPQKWIERLKLEVEKYDFFVLAECHDKGLNLPIVDVLEGEKSGTIAFFRVDDDDILSSSYIDQLKKYLRKEFEGMIVSFGSGLMAGYENKAYYDFRVCHRRLLALGMAFIGSYDSIGKSYKLPKGGGHETVDLNAAVIIDSRIPTFVWTHHKNQDTKSKSSSNSVANHLSRHAKIKSVDGYLSHFPTLEKDFLEFMARNRVAISERNIKIPMKEFLLKPISHIPSNRFEVEYHLQDKINENLDLFEKAFLFSFNFSEEVEVISGLKKSANQNIGWFSYVNLKNGKSIKKFTFETDRNVSLDSLKFVFWHSKNSSVDILSISIKSI